jgi:hypothetical protein
MESGTQSKVQSGFARNAQKDGVSAAFMEKDVAGRAVQSSCTQGQSSRVIDTGPGFAACRACRVLMVSSDLAHQAISSAEKASGER